MRKQLLSLVACCKQKPAWALSIGACAGLVLVVVAFMAVRRGPSSADAAAAQKAKALPTLVWTVATGEGLPPATKSHSIALNSNSNAPVWGPGKVSVRLAGGRTLEYTAESLFTFEVTNVGPEVRIRFPKQPLAPALAQTRALLGDWRLTMDGAYLDRWHTRRSDPNNRTPSSTWASTMGSRVPAIVTLTQPKREQDQWEVVLQVFPKHVR